MGVVFGEFDEEDFQLFVKDQRDSRWLAWLDSIPDQLDRFLIETVPGMPLDPYSSRGLNLAEGTAVAYFADAEAIRAPLNRGLAEQFAVFLGEVFRRSFDGAWINVPDHDETGMGFCPVVRFPFTNMDIHVRVFLAAAVEQRTTIEWVTVWTAAAEIEAAWWKAGKPTRSQWLAAKWIPPEEYDDEADAMKS
ncbi:hypothetical protein [Nocardia bhagyanarayanae]|uniref:hypothetical protein n=1 Tax=Nocardia bhagyanarayanae TaxID=1215925 RepID=UPI00114F4D36|nr:hypothetical protein [Nocardia bhagyanarayanae]